MKWTAGHLFDGWNNLRFLLSEWGAAIDRAMDVWGDDTAPEELPLDERIRNGL